MAENKTWSGGSRLIDFVRNQIPSQLGIELATIVTQPPDLRIRIDNSQLIFEKEDLLVCNNAWHAEEDEKHYLSKGERVVVMALPGGQQYLIWDKVVIP